MLKVRKNLNILLILSSLLISSNTLLSCDNNKKDKVEVKINTFKGVNLNSVIKLDDTNIQNYFLSYNSFFLLVTDDTETLNQANNYIKNTSLCLYYLDTDSYNKLIENFNFEKEYYPTIKKGTNYLFSLNSDNKEDHMASSSSLSEDEIATFISKHSINRNFIDLNAPRKEEDSILPYSILSVDSVVSSFMDIDSSNPSNYVLNEGKIKTNYFDLIKEDTAFVYFGRKTCGDCTQFDEEFIEPYYKQNKDSKLYFFDIQYFEYQKSGDDTNQYILSRQLTNKLGANFKYNVNPNYRDKITLDEDELGTRFNTDNYVFRTPVITKIVNGSKDSNIVFTNDRIELDETDNSYFVATSSYNDETIFSMKNKSKDTLRSKLLEYQLTKIKDFVSK